MLGIAPRHRMILKFAKAACKGHVLAGRDVLVAQEQYTVPEQRLPDAGEYAVIVNGIDEADATSSAPMEQVSCSTRMATPSNGEVRS